MIRRWTFVCRVDGCHQGGGWWLDAEDQDVLCCPHCGEPMRLLDVVAVVDL